MAIQLIAPAFDLCALVGLNPLVRVNALAGVNFDPVPPPNVIFELIGGLSAASEGAKKGMPVIADRHSNWVATVGIEQHT